MLARFVARRRHVRCRHERTPMLRGARMRHMRYGAANVSRARSARMRPRCASAVEEEQKIDDCYGLLAIADDSACLLRVMLTPVIFSPDAHCRFFSGRALAAVYAIFFFFFFFFFFACRDHGDDVLRLPCRRRLQCLRACCRAFIFFYMRDMFRRYV